MVIKTILIGERVNSGGREPSKAWRTIYLDPERYWEVMRRHGGFRWAQGYEREEAACWAKLRSVLGDIKIHHEINLCVPHPISGHWRLQEARAAAQCLVRSCPTPCLFIACGTRVARAIWRAVESWPYPEVPGLIVGGPRYHLTRIPHPSGRNPQYNDATFVCEVAKRLRANLEMLDENRTRTARLPGSHRAIAGADGGSSRVRTDESLAARPEPVPADGL